MNLSRAIATIGGYTMVSRVLGFLRDILMAALLGTGLVADAFFVAFKLPNFFRRLFAEGAFNAAFVPLFAHTQQSEGSVDAETLAAEVLSVLLTVLFVFVSLMQVGMPVAMLVLAPGFADEPAKFDLTVDLARVTFTYLLFISLVSLQGGILNSLGRFAAVAATPVLLNLCMIGALLVAAQAGAAVGHALAWGVALAGVVQFWWLAYELRRTGFRLVLPRPRLSRRVRETLRLMAPGALGAGAVQINLLVDVVIASFLPQGSISFLYYADRVNELPVGVIGIAVGTAMLPLLSRQVAAGDERGIQATQNRAVEAALLLALPATAGTLALAFPIVSVLFQRGAFDPAATGATAWALIAFTCGLPAYVLIKVLTPGYFARKDTRTPVRIAILSLVVNLSLNLALMGPLKHVGLALATALAAWLNAALLAVIQVRRRQWQLDDRLRRRAPRIAAAAAVMTVVVLAAGALLRDWAGAPGETVSLVLLIALGGLVFAASAHALGAARLGDLRALVSRGVTPGGPST
ncbi:MAG: murein biosynthesis integral membrane protein MurJ [Alphaproteobacteria bacterium]|nr:murein biosynthesis integral membrane protein MurJ [Alphaproteobacteria bacterium]